MNAAVFPLGLAASDPGGLLPVLTGAAVGLLAWSVYVLNRDFIGSVVTSARDRESARTLPAFLRAVMPMARPLGFWFRQYAARLERDWEGRRRQPPPIVLQERIRRLLISAGSPGEIEPAEFLGTSAALGSFGLVCGLVIWAWARSFAAGEGSTGVPAAGIILPGLLLGLFFPFLWLNDRVKRRRLEIRKAMPYALDLLSLSVEAGLDFTTAMLRICRKIEGRALGEEFGRILREIQMGRSRAQALRDAAWRIGVTEFNSFAGALIQADELGANIGPVLRIQAEQLRIRRGQRAEEQAMKIPVKIIFPLVFFIFPITFVVIFGPIVIALIK